MKRIMIILVVVTGVYQLWSGGDFNKISGIDTPAGPYVLVYGRDSCGYTRRMRSQLGSAGISYRYKTVDDQQVAGSLHKKMRSAGVDTRRYNLPVVEVNAYILVRPGIGEVVDLY